MPFPSIFLFSIIYLHTKHLQYRTANKAKKKKIRSIIVLNKMNPLNLSFLVLTIIISLISSCCFVNSQQPYIRKASTGCSNTDPSTSVYGYTCNGETPTCQSYLTFFSQPPYNTVSSISSLLAADPSQLAKLNSVAMDSSFETASIVLVPVNCSCSGTHYQVNASYVVKKLDLFNSIANNVFEGLTTCVAIEAQNKNLTAELLYAGTSLTVPLRCACPTKNQTDKGIKYLLSYVINWGDSVSAISEMFKVDTGTTFQANGLSDQDSVIYPNTTLLIPLQTPPSSSQINQSPPTPLVQPPQSPPAGSGSPSKGKSSKAWIYAVVGVLAGLAIATISLLLVYFYCLRKKKVQKPVAVSNSAVETPSFESIEKPSPSEKSDIWDNITNFAKSINVYTYKELQRATEDFSPSYWIKGSVYRGVINGDLAAIKKKTGDVSEEINLLNKINHFNLIRLSGLCFDEGQWYLVYEYAANGSLSDWINSKKGDDKKNFLNWNQRIQIALDVATGLNYLHSYTNPPHVHKDLTSNNVFLDTDLRAKIGNIGLARSATQEEGEFAMTRHIVGTKGYMAPEYLEHGLVSPKLDVYAFGVLLMEIITGREVSASLTEFQLPSFEGKDDVTENLNNFIDPSLKGEYPSELAILVVKLIDSCLQKNLSARPGMHEVVQALSTIMETDLSFEYKLSLSVDK